MFVRDRAQETGRRSGRRHHLAIDEVVAPRKAGERVSAGAAANRVYAALARLRTLGLREALVRDREGWRIDPAIELVVE